MATTYDVIVIGSGHNGLVCGAYLAKSGLKTLVLERREIVGGAAVTEEFSPGFRASRFSYVMSLLHPRVIRDLELNSLDRKSTRLNSSHSQISYAVFCLKKKKEC